MRQGLLLSDPGEKMDSMSLLTYMAPVAVLSLLPTMLLFEPGALGAAVALGRDGRERRQWGVAVGCVCMCGWGAATSSDSSRGYKASEEGKGVAGSWP